MDIQNRTPHSSDYPYRDKDPMQQLQVIHIPREYREKLRQAYRERTDNDAEEVTEGLGTRAAFALIGVLYVVGLLIANATGLSAAVLESITPAARSLITVIALAGAAISVFWIIYAFVKSYTAPEDHTDYA